MPTQTEVLTKLFSFFEAQKISYAVLGNCRQLPEQIPSDIDFAINPPDLSRVFRELRKFCHIHHIRLTQIIQHEQTAWYVVLSWQDNIGQLRFLQPDICGDYFQFGRQVLSAQTLLENRQKYLDPSGFKKMFYVPPPAISFIYYLLKKITKGRLTADQCTFLSEEWQKDPDGAYAQCLQYWPCHLVEVIAHSAVQNEWNTFSHRLPVFRETLHQYGFQFNHVMKEFKRKLTRIISPTGLHIALLGPDGSGKSTLASAITETLTPAFRGSQIWHLWPYQSHSGSNASPNVMPHSQAPRSGFSSLVKLVYWWVIFTVGYFHKVWPSKISSRLIVFDRYFDDLLIDPIRYRYGGPLRLAQWVGRFIPKPDLLFILDAPVNTLHSRKKEVLASEATRQRTAYRNLCHDQNHCFLIDTSLPLEAALSQIQDIILEFLEIRISRQYQSPQTDQTSRQQSLKDFLTFQP